MTNSPVKRIASFLACLINKNSNLQGGDGIISDYPQKLLIRHLLQKYNHGAIMEAFIYI